MRKAEMSLETAPEFEARDTHGRLVRLSMIFAAGRSY